MSELTQEDLAAVALDVRKAYRLLYLFQSRVMDTVKFIAEQLGRNYHGGWCWFSNVTPRDGRGSLDNWAWDWLNMYHYEFFLGEELVGEHRIRLAVVLQSDTGFYDQAGAEQTDIRSFAPVEVSETRLRFLIGKNTWHGEFESEFSPTAVRACTGYTNLKTADGNGTLITKAFPITAFLDEQSTRQVLAEFVAHCHLHGIPEIGLTGSPVTP
ncbi:hypothetical protein [Hymenobacter latericus]|uniref:hypothetical protein n=1 Tax=Hymenobacter sp. YIM 151858-1 TaxID=2987688 RepID=UPI002226D573|nr:hypothetical protein [Hymenobacter sp. YIM 151858-1]UYZ58062.1 hypothetical protein OIS50_13455 [Hymenobacter sp. YIM 151858-1]